MSAIPLTFVELRYCGAVACLGANRSIEEYYFLGGGRAGDGISCVLPSTYLVWPDPVACSCEHVTGMCMSRLQAFRCLLF